MFARYIFAVSGQIWVTERVNVITYFFITLFSWRSLSWDPTLTWIRWSPFFNTAFIIVVLNLMLNLFFFHFFNCGNVSRWWRAWPWHCLWHIRRDYPEKVLESLVSLILILPVNIRVNVTDAFRRWRYFIIVLGHSLMRVFTGTLCLICYYFHWSSSTYRRNSQLTLALRSYCKITWTLILFLGRHTDVEL